MSEKEPKKPKLVAPSVGQCVWVDAGVLSYRLCTLNYECERCSLHQALTDGPVTVKPDSSPAPNLAELEKQRAEFEKFFKKLPASARKCRYMLSGDVSYKLCIDAFKCATCSFNQMIEDSVALESDVVEGGLQTVNGLRVNHEVHYHRCHTWVRVERNGDVRIGLDDFGQWLLGTVRNVRLPATGEALYEGIAACELALEAGRIGVLAPISGKVIARNEKLLERPRLVNESPFGGGWLLMVKPSDLSSELACLLYGQEARRWAEMEIGRINERTKEDRSHWPGDLVPQMAGEFLLSEMKKAA
jgi:glycine cleavage system H lipoate-binding protein